ncbi:MAG: tetratricopeptide repeat protein [Geitlerinemataceae cyanobacterium]
MTTLRDRYFATIDTLVEMTLAGRVRSKEQIYRRLERDVDAGTGEIFEACLSERAAQFEAESGMKATRKLRATATISSEFERWQQNNRDSGDRRRALTDLQRTEPEARLMAIVRAIDPNRENAWNAARVAEFAQQLLDFAESGEPDDVTGDTNQLAELGNGLRDGLRVYRELEDVIVSWIYERTAGSLGFGETAQRAGPWAIWAKRCSSHTIAELFATIDRGEPSVDFIRRRRDFDERAWLELALLLQGLQRGLVSWFDRQPYSIDAGKQVSSSAFLVFGAIWGQIAEGFASGDRSGLADASFTMSIQILRAFARRDTFPLYGGVFASFGGDYLSDTLDYLERPLQRVPGTQEKARILTLLGYSQAAIGNYDRAAAFHTDALDTARTAADRPCEVASLNHLSRLCATQKQYQDAIDRAQRALITARQMGDRLGEANALVNLGYSQVLRQQQTERPDAELYESAIAYLNDGLDRAEKLDDRQSLALGCYSLGVALVTVDRPSRAIDALTRGLKFARESGDLYLQGKHLLFLAEAHYALDDELAAIATASIAAFSLERIDAREWRQAASLLSALRGRLGAEAFAEIFERARKQVVAAIGVEGYEAIDDLLDR